ncbi:MAG: hypothetical protein C4K48_10885 [Candidatus Thorarchaeota archaeon]|nr:MAG: hypothetical protein C4K48_10885 [Candidatus Thorarchaeota archaeon]
MAAENSKAIFVAMTIIMGVSAAAFLSMSNSGDWIVVENTLGIANLTILANSTGLLYPELCEASFVFLDYGSWLVNANFMNDSVYWYEYLEIYDRNSQLLQEK